VSHNNQPIIAPDFIAIESEAGKGTADACRSLWFYLINEVSKRSRLVKHAQERIEPKVLPSTPTGATNDLNSEDSSVIHFSGSTNFTLSGILAPGPSKARMILLHNTGSATITVAHQSGSSVAENRIVTSTGANKSLGTSGSLLLIYLSDRWRDIAL
jgi:hypothetical protein